MQLTEPYKVQLFTGTVTHFVDPHMPVPPGTVESRRPSLCNLVPIWPSIWLATAEGDPLPVCKTCEVLVGRLLSVQ
jgi:hypothetical protein